MEDARGVLLKRRRTKIVATLGPASSDPGTIERLVAAGVDVFRLNMSHGTHAEHRAAYDRVRAAAVKRDAPIAVLVDLCGPKLRVGRFAGGRIDLPPGERVVVTVSTAVFGGADAVMLSAETASGAHPVAAVEMMDRVARQVEGYQWSEGAFGSISANADQPGPLPLHVAVARSTAQLSRDLRVRSVVVLSRSGTTVGVVAAARPAAPVVAVTTDAGTCRRMNLLWGVVPIQVSPADLSHRPALARRAVTDLGLASRGQHILTVAGFRPEPQESAPVVTALSV